MIVETGWSQDVGAVGQVPDDVALAHHPGHRRPVGGDDDGTEIVLAEQGNQFLDGPEG